ncbi:MAG: YqaE/Pmp3 family membrane protein [Flavobacteriales bacterium]
MLIPTSKELKNDNAAHTAAMKLAETPKIKTVSVQEQTATIAAHAHTAKQVIPANKKAAIDTLKKESIAAQQVDDALVTILLLILCFILPPLAVGLATGFELAPLLISILLTLLFWIPGVIYAIIVILRR